MASIGIDLGGTNIAVGVVDHFHKIVARSERKTLANRPAEEIFLDVAKTVWEAIAAAGLQIQEIKRVGIGTPGSVRQSDGNIIFAANLGFRDVPAKEILEKILNLPVKLENDANCAALGETFAGAGRGVDSLIAVTLGTGVGAGIVIDGKIMSGVNGAAGECGHMVIDMRGLRCSCGRRGCWEAYASASALISQTKTAMREKSGTICWEITQGKLEDVDGRTAFLAKRRGDATGKSLIETYIRYLAIGIGNLINIFQPARVCIGGGLAGEGAELLDPLKAIIDEERFVVGAPQTELVLAELGNNAGIIGASML